MKETTNKINFKGKVCTFGKMEISTRDNLLEVIWMGKEDGGLEMAMSM